MARKDIQIMLEEAICSKNVYYQPPESIRLVYPCIVYNLNSILKLTANDKAYKINKSYQVTRISKLADDPAVDRILELPYCSFDRYYVSDNLHHYVFTIYDQGGK